MNEVVLRCPNCGTTQGMRGECDACHEAEVRYFCPNHSPGRWLDAPLCAGCGATVSHGPISRGAPPPPPAPPRGPPRPRTSAGPSTGAPADRPRRTPTTPRSSATERPLPPPPAPARSPLAGAAPIALEMLRRAAHASRRAVSAPTEPRGVPVLGCLFRLALVLAFVVLLAIAAVWLLAGGAVGSWFVEVGQSTGVMGGVPAQTERGIVAYREGDVALAESELEQSARSYRRSALALLYLARIRADAGDQEGARRYLEEAVTREPDDVTARRLMGEYHLTRARRLLAGPAKAVDAASELMAAETNLERAVELAPSDKRARGYLACVLGMLNRPDEARAALAVAGSGPWDDCLSSPVP